MVNEMSLDDHDALIRLEGAVEGMRHTLDVTSAAQAERHGRMESKIDRINGTVAAHESRIHQLSERPIMPIDHDEAETLVGQTREMWTAYRFGRWVAMAATLALLGQAAALIILAVEVATGN